MQWVPSYAFVFPCVVLTLKYFPFVVQLTTAVYGKPLQNGKDDEDAIKNVIRLDDEL